jgi:6-phosphogluconolactonase
MPGQVVIVHPSKDVLIEAVADRFISTVSGLQVSSGDDLHVCLTGGSVGIAVLAAAARPRADTTVDWERVHFWWGDERWVPSGHADRNDQQAADAFLDRVPVPRANIHRFPASDEIEFEVAADAYAAELRAHAADGASAPVFAITFLGVGPDGHVASLFPHHEQLDATESVVAVHDSPKPPPERLSLTLPVLNASTRVWLAIAGADKASAVGLALAGANLHLVPVAGVQGREETVFFMDADAATDVPRDLIVDGSR